MGGLEKKKRDEGEREIRGRKSEAHRVKLRKGERVGRKRSRGSGVGRKEKQRICEKEKSRAENKKNKVKKNIKYR